MNEKDLKIIKYRRTYSIERFGKKRFRLCRVLKEYDNLQDALDDQHRLFRKEVTDDDVYSTWIR